MKVTFLIGFLLALPATLLHLLFPVAIVYHEPLRAETTLIILAVSMALSFAASLLLAPEAENPTPDDKPTTLSKRGSFISWHLGIRRIGPVFGWAGNRSIAKEGKTGKNKPPQQRIYHEDGWHILCVGPCEALHGIFQNGERIFSGPITRTSHPSGTTVTLGIEGEFTIYWGEADQPIPGYPLTSISRTVDDYVSSRWPFICHIVWEWKRLGPSARWPSMEYAIERRQSNSVLSDTDGWVEPDETLDLTQYDIVAHNDGVEDAGYLEVEGNHTSQFIPGQNIKLTGNAMGDGNYVVKTTSTREAGTKVVDNPGNLNDVWEWKTYTRVFPFGGVSGADDNGYMQAFDVNQETGIRPAHAVAEVLFSSWPKGLGLSQDDWDIDSLEEFGVLTDDGSDGEDIWTSWYAPRGKTAKQMLAEGLLDMGVLLPLDTDSGKIAFRPLRKPDSLDGTITQDMLLDPLPERETTLQENRPNQLVFEFPDVALNWRKMTITIADDGHASYAEFAQAKIIPMNVVNHFLIAAQVAERRSQETLSGGSAFTIHTNRWARTLMPGDVISVYDFEETLLVISVDMDGDTGKVTLKCIPNYFDVVASDFRPDQTAPTVVVEPVANDLFCAVEVPRKVLGGSNLVSMVVPRIRAHDQMGSAMVHISEDNTTYDEQAEQIESHNGGALLEAIAEDDPYIIDEGPTFTAFGPDIADVLDLSASESLWRSGRQVCFIGKEIFFLKKVTAIGGTTYRLDGLIRARFDTRRAAHAVGRGVFIVPNDELLIITDTSFEPDATIYTKSQPSGVGGVVQLGNIAPYQTVLYGKGTRPEPVENLRVTAPFKGVAAYTTGDDISFRWSWYSLYGAGHRPAGDPQPDHSPEGEFFVQIKTDADVVKREFTTTDLTYVYSNANLSSDFGSEPSSFKIVVSWLKDGWESTTKELTVEKVS